MPPYSEDWLRHQLAANPALHIVGGEDRPSPPAPISERAFQRAQARLARERGYLYYHTQDSRKSPRGWPDTVLLHPSGGTLYVWENKVVGASPTIEQAQWLTALQHVTAVHAAIYTPDDWPTIVALLQPLPRRV